MKIAKRCKVEVRKDHLSKVAASRPKAALAELIWNSLDADADNVNVNFTIGALGIERVTVSDDGIGIPYKEAEALFTSLGGSWKATKQKTETGRFLHGKEGEGRFKAFALGRIVDWKVTYSENNNLFDYTIEGRGDTLDEFVLSDIAESSRKSTGVTVEISELNKKFHVIDPEKALDQLAPLFAPYLSNYKTVSLRINGDRADPDSLIRTRKSFPLSPIEIGGQSAPVELDLVEWDSLSDREMWFCDSRGFPLEPYVKQVRGIGNFGYTAYLRSDYFRALHNEGSFALGELEQTISPVFDEAVKTIKEYFLVRQLEETKDQLEEWKQEEVYPYQGEPITLVEEAERKVFDIVAININQNLPDFSEASKKSRQFQFRMLRHAIEKSPEDLQKILTEVLNLPKSEREQLAGLLEDTSLASIINASQIVADRINFVTALEQILYNYKDHIKERNQLHRLLAKNTWIFGDAFTLSVDDRSLTEVLKKHAELKGLATVINEPVRRVDGKKGVIDLMLSRQIPRNHENELEHLVVELKRPSVKISKQEIDQIESYALAVAKDERFRGVDTKWHFWIISNDYDEYADIKLNAEGNKEGVLFRFTKDMDVTVWLKTWSQLLRENDHRLRFIRDKLNYNINSEQALRYLKKTYVQYIENIGENWNLNTTVADD
ncbi:MAG: ATP-binding protein [Candidatus Thiosymbion ectosymbiont of Robbea hypermnestra]|nr:ATP-binding protein [Candidatus Thiosymbion ectosymbiont of Robbea hypermnestra]